MSPRNSSASQSTNQQSNNFNDAEKHYNSLIDLFKYSVTLLTIFLGLIGGILGYLIYSDGKEMREALKTEKKEMKDNISEMKAELRDQEKELKGKELKMEKSISALILLTDNEVKNTREIAINKISGIKDVAINESRARIDEVFRERNLEQFVTDLAKEKMEPKIKSLIDDGFSRIEKEKAERLNEKLNDLFSSDKIVATQAIGFFQLQNNYNYTEGQVTKIIEAYKTTRFPDLKTSYLVFMIYIKSEQLVPLFKHEFLNNEDASITIVVMQYLMLIKKNNDLSMYRDFVRRSNNKSDAYFRMVDFAGNGNVHLMMLLLDDKTLVEMVISSTDKAPLEAIKENMRQNLRKAKAPNFENTLFLKN